MIYLENSELKQKGPNIPQSSSTLFCFIPSLCLVRALVSNRLPLSLLLHFIICCLRKSYYHCRGRRELNGHGEVRGSRGVDRVEEVKEDREGDVNKSEAGRGRQAEGKKIEIVS